MSAIGIDFGNYKTCIAVARKCGIDIIVNEVSNRFTPSKVSFSNGQRLLGEQAKTQEIANYKNTFSDFKKSIELTTTMNQQPIQQQCQMYQ